MWFDTSIKGFTLRKRVAPAPNVPFYAIGDIHGHNDKLLAALDLIDQLDEPALPIVCLGDYVDRGPENRAVLQTLRSTQMLRGADFFVCLMGNHEAMLLSALQKPQTHALKWLQAGGLQTAREYHVKIPKPNAGAQAWANFALALEKRLGERTVDWLRSLPTRWSSGNVIAVHAGADPALGIKAQIDSVCVWGHKHFLSKTRRDNVWVVHGHTIVPNPIATRQRISIDTGVYKTNRLTVARIGVGQTNFYSI